MEIRHIKLDDGTGIFLDENGNPCSRHIQDFSEEIKITSLELVKYQPIKNSRFICKMPMIDSYLVRYVNVPQLTVNENNKLVSEEPIFIRYNECVAPSTKQQVAEAIKVLKTLPPEERVLHIKQIDMIGNVISNTHFTNVKIVGISILENLNYDYEDLSVVDVKVAFDEAIIDF